MEELIPLLIIVASGIISFFSSSRKQKGNKKRAESFNVESTAGGETTTPSQRASEGYSNERPLRQAAQESNDRSWYDEVENQQESGQSGREGSRYSRDGDQSGASRTQAWEDDEYHFPEGDTVEEKKQAVIRKHRESSENGDEKEEEKAGGKEKPPAKKAPGQGYKKRKRKTPGRSKIDAIREDFDLEEAIIYSEILHRKYH
jgi:hypothetical protein